MTKRYSTSYVMTASVDSEKDMEYIKLLREAVSCYNRKIKTEDLDKRKKRVVLRGRKPKENKLVTNFWTGKSSYRSYGCGGNIVGGIKNATVIDVYVYYR